MFAYIGITKVFSCMSLPFFKALWRFRKILIDNGDVQVSSGLGGLNGVQGAIDTIVAHRRFACARFFMSEMYAQLA